MPAIDKLYQSMKSENIAFLAVTSEDEERVRAFVKKREIQVPVYLCQGDFRPDLPTEGGFPTTYILDRQGAAKFRLVGPANWDDDGVRTFIRGLATN